MEKLEVRLSTHEKKRTTKTSLTAAAAGKARRGGVHTQVHSLEACLFFPFSSSINFEHILKLAGFFFVKLSGCDEHWICKAETWQLYRWQHCMAVGHQILTVDKTFSFWRLATLLQQAESTIIQSFVLSPFYLFILCPSTPFFLQYPKKETLVLDKTTLNEALSSAIEIRRHKNEASCAKENIAEIIKISRMVRFFFDDSVRETPKFQLNKKLFQTVKKRKGKQTTVKKILF